MSYKDDLESAITVKVTPKGKKKFSCKYSMCCDIESKITNTYIRTDLARLKKILPGSEYKNFKKVIIRFSFFIAFTDRSVGTDATRTNVRWASELNGDPRFATYDECEKICQKVIHKIVTASTSDLSLLRDYCRLNAFTEALPIDYIRKIPSGIHSALNVDVFTDDATRDYVKIRSIITDPSRNPDHSMFNMIYKDKLETKAYKTDRTQTGDFKTNREWRWETLPNNFQFAFRRDCDSVINQLILGVCRFKNCNPTLVSALQGEKLLSSPLTFYRCPITGDELDYNEFVYEIQNPEHGKSAYQVGHMSPLKLGGIHRGDNVAWETLDGNRIQGNLSETEVNDLLKRIFTNRPELTV